MRTVRPLTREEHEAFRVARLVAAEQAPYFMHVLFAVAPVAAPGLGTLAVDAQWRLYLDPDLLVGEHPWTPAVLAAGLAHEAGHLLRDHAGRAEALPIPRHHDAWNVAGDAEINDDLIASGIPLPEWAITPTAIGCPDGDLAESYYAHLTGDPATPPPDGDDGEPGCGSGAGCPPVPGELPAGVALPDGTAEPAHWAGERFGVRVSAAQPLAALTHAFTHFVLELQPVLLQVPAARTATAAAAAACDNALIVDCNS